MVGAQVRKLRERAGWRQLDLAKEARVSANTVCGLERGQRHTRRDKVQRIAMALGTTLEALERGEAISDDDPVFKGLSLEDGRIGRLFHDAETKLRIAVKRLLLNGSRDPMLLIWERLERLNARRREDLMSSLEQHEKALAAEQQALPVNQKPRK